MKAAKVGLLVILAGCGSSAPPPAPKAAAAAPLAAAPKASKAAVAATSEAAKDSFVYSSIGKRDPFRSPIDDLIALANSNKGGGNNCPLCRWGVDQLKLVAVISGTGSPVAMVEDPNGIGHMLRQGTNVGRMGGKVTSIQRDQIVVTEISHDPFGKVVQTRSPLKIEQPQEDPTTAAPSLLNE